MSVQAVLTSNPQVTGRKTHVSCKRILGAVISGLWLEILLPHLEMVATAIRHVENALWLQLMQQPVMLGLGHVENALMVLCFE